jgi:hypothetical protein
VSGTGIVTFVDASAIDTTATFSAAGTYVLRITAHDGALSASDELTIHVDGEAEPPPNETITTEFQDGVSAGGTYQGTRDTTLLSSNKNVNSGSAPRLQTDGSPDRAMLIAWDTSTIEPGSIIESAEITLYVGDTSDDNYQIYAMNRSWIEHEATWNISSQGVRWETAGALGITDRNSTVLGTLTGNSEGFITVTLNAAGRTIVQSWIDDPESNFGLIVENFAGASNGIIVASSESTVAARRPKLTITYATS